MTRFLFILALFFSITSYAQNTHYVTASTLNLRSEASTSSEIIVKLSQHDNLEVISEDELWAKVEINDKSGYVHKEYIKKGKAIVSYYSVRVGAKCKDGTSSNATGRGACSHHDGVDYWKTVQKKSVRIVDNK